jgi:hypothetical protein
MVRICYRYHPFFGKTVEIVRWLRRQTTESLVVKLPDGLELAIPAWMLDPLACSLVHDAPAPYLTVEALVALRDLLDRQPLLHAAIPATPCVSQPEGARDAQESSSSPSGAGPWGVLTFREDKRTRQSYTDPAQTPLCSTEEGSG